MTVQASFKANTHYIEPKTNFAPPSSSSLLGIIKKYFLTGEITQVVADHQDNIKEGKVRLSTLIKIVDILNHAYIEGIQFNHNTLLCRPSTKSCSAKSLDFLAYSFEKIVEYGNHPNMNLLDQFKKSIRNWKQQNKDRLGVFRARQTAFNTVEITNPKIDHSKQKIAGLSSFHGFKISGSTKEYNLKNELPSEKDLVSLPKGFYFLRCINPTNKRRKLEYFGHSMAWIKVSNQHGFFYDTNGGCDELNSRKAQVHRIQKAFSDCNQKWNTYLGRIYKLESTTKTPYTLGEKRTIGKIHSRL